MSRWRHRVWRFLGSRDLAVVLLAILLLALLLVSFFPQMPSEPAALDVWLEAVSLRFGPATGVLNALGLFDAFHAPWFQILLSALLVNTLVCTVQRVPGLWRSLTSPPTVQRPDAFYQGLAHQAALALSSREEGLTAARAALARHRFRRLVDVEPASLYAERGRWSQIATPVSHLAAVVLVVAIACRPAMGWQESDLVLLPGEGGYKKSGTCKY